MSEHPSKHIKGTNGEELKNRHIVLCVTGSVAAVQSPEIARALMRRGAEVHAVMTQMAQKIIHPHVMEWATGNSVVTELTGKIEHVALVGEHSAKADLVLIAPATANTISKIACGIDDTSVTSVASTAFGSKVPLMIVPAMHESMYNNPLLLKNMTSLRELGVDFVGPRIEEGKAKIASTEEIVAAVMRKIALPKDFVGLNVLVTAGPTIENIDPIRVITNRSSGKMGVALGEEALKRGANVTFIYGTGSASPPFGATTIRVDTTKQMYEAVFSELKSKKYGLVMAVAAAADWTPEKAFPHKVSTHRVKSLSLQLRPTQKIIDSIKKECPNVFLLAFRAEYNLSEEELIQSAHDRLLKAHADLIAANDVAKEGVGFGTETNEVFVVDKAKHITHIPLSPKREVARMLLDIISEKMKHQK